MSDKHNLDPASRGGGGRTPQPPARPGGSSSKPNTQPRSRASTPTGAGEVTAVSPSPTVSAVAGAKSNGAARQPKTISINNNNRSPRTFNSTRKPKRDEPASDDDGDAASRFVEPPNDEWLRQSELTLATMEKQVHDAAKRTLKHQTRCATMKASIVGKEERMDTLRGTYTTLTRALDELEVVSNGDIDSDALEAMFNSIPPDARAAALGPIDHLYSS